MATSIPLDHVAGRLASPRTVAFVTSPFLYFAWLALLFAALLTPLAQATQVIANWDLVPGQMIDRPFKVGVVAFHETGAAVDFAVNGQAAASVDDPAWNDRTGVWEYWFELDPADYEDGPLTVSATAKPDGDGEDRTLAELTLYANANGSLANDQVIWVDWDNGDDANPGTEAAPKKNIMAGVDAAGDGGTVYLKAGENYKLTDSGGSFTYWTTVSAAPGLAPDQVKILTYGPDDTSTGRYSKSGIRWRNVSFFGDRGPRFSNIFYINNGQRMWFDGCWLYDKNGRWNGTTVFNNQGGSAFVTNSKISDVNVVGGFFQRNLLIERIGSDIYGFGNGITAINVTIRLIDRGETGAHPDFIQLYNPGRTSENVILYNIRCYDMEAQGFFGGDGAAEDIAFVNILLEKDPSDSPLRSQLTGSWNHVLFWNIVEIDQTLDLRDTTDIKHVDVRNSVLAKFTSDNADHPSINISHVHSEVLNWNQTEPLGTEATIGDPLFVDESVDDYRLTSESPASGTGALPPGVPADIDGYAFDPAAPNRGVFAKQNPGSATASRPTRIAGVSFADKDAAVESKAVIQLEPGRRYRVQGSDDLAVWEEMDTLFAAPDGVLNLFETFPAMPVRRFYRFQRMSFPAP